MEGDAELNPYAAPRATESLPALPATQDAFYREGGLLLVRDGAVLPSRCIHTNQPIGPHDRTRRLLLIWTPPWVWLLIPLLFVPALIVSMVVSKKAFITLSMSRAAWKRLVQRKLIAFFSAVVGGVVGFGSLAICLEQDLLVLGVIGGTCGLGVFFASLIVLVTGNPVTVKGYRDGWFSLKGCSKEFLDSLEPGLSAAPLARP